MEGKALIMCKSVLFDDISDFVDFILTFNIQRRKKNPRNLFDFLQRKWENESVGHVFFDQQFQEMLILCCTFMVSKLDGCVYVD
jgi:hypothetical protein